jgi:hypothetical protein
MNRRPDNAQGKTVAEYDDLARVIHAAIETLEAAGQISDRGAEKRYAPFNGYCARACAAYAYLAEHEPSAQAKSTNLGMKLKKLKEQGAPYGDSHYWLEDDEGRVLDLIFCKRKRLPRDIPYRDGKGATVRRDRRDTRLPAAKDTQRIIAVVRAAIR